MSRRSTSSGTDGPSAADDDMHPSFAFNARRERGTWLIATDPANFLGTPVGWPPHRPTNRAGLPPGHRQRARGRARSARRFPSPPTAARTSSCSGRIRRETAKVGEPQAAGAVLTLWRDLQYANHPRAYHGLAAAVRAAVPYRRVRGALQRERGRAGAATAPRGVGAAAR